MSRTIVADCIAAFIFLIGRNEIERAIGFGMFLGIFVLRAINGSADKLAHPHDGEHKEPQT